MTKRRIDEWVDEYGSDGVYVSFSGGKDSTVLVDIVRNICGYKDIPLVFIDVPTQYPELKQFAQTFDNLEILKPKISFAEVCRKYGFPLISKEVSECVYGAKSYLTKLLKENAQLLTDRQLPYKYYYEKPTATGKYGKFPKPISSIDDASVSNPTKGGNDRKYRRLRGIGEFAKRENEEQMRWKQSKTSDNVRDADNMQGTTGKANIPSEDKSQFSQERYEFLLYSKFDISNKCCNVMKKEPAHRYFRQTGRKPITATMASESKLRTQKWLQNGCNGFDLKIPTSNPMSFWIEQDVLLYIKENNLPICSVYGDVVIDYLKMGQCENQMSFADYGIFDNERPLLKTTGCQRTGCVLCGFGCHLEKEPNQRFVNLKKTHPKFHNLLYILKNNGVTYAEAIDWVNEHGGFDIKY